MANVNATSGTDSAAALNALLGVQGSQPSAADQTGDRFLKLLVTQMQNQDPLNPMDNAQLTSQMAQINTVSGISKLNEALTSMSGLLVQMQALQGASLVGRDVLVSGNAIEPDAQGKAHGGYEIDAPADSVVVTITDAGGKVVDSVNLGPADAGRHTFDWTSSDPNRAGLSFSIAARAGKTSVPARTLVADKVESVYVDGGKLTVELQHHGAIDYSAVRAFN
jgi:flagellar basal-body rod modification protein FlgD